MTGFSAEWLALREPFDREARRVAAALIDPGAIAARLRRDDAALAVLDLACGTGANLRELAPRLRGPQRWTLVDHDPLLLDALPDVLGAWARCHGHSLSTGDGCLRLGGPGWSAEVRALRADLATAMDDLPFAQARLVTASALLDLVSLPWLDRLIEHTRSSEAAVLFALNVDGRVEWMPGIEGDEAVQRLFAAHQHRDKGFGAALGADAVDAAARRLAAAGYAVDQAASDWCIDGGEGASAAAMLRAMVEGWAAAALQQAPADRARIEGWRARRLALIGQTYLRIGHRELVGAMPAY